jgi:hypothetical protein
MGSYDAGGRGHDELNAVLYRGGGVEEEDVLGARSDIYG